MPRSTRRSYSARCHRRRVRGICPMPATVAGRGGAVNVRGPIPPAPSRCYDFRAVTADRGGRLMTLATRRLHPLFGAEILGVDVKRVDDATFPEIVAAFNEYSVLLFRGQSLTDEEQIAFSQRFGPLETTIRSINTQERTLPHIANLANVDAEDRLIPRGDKRNVFNAGNQMWHTDSSFKRVPALASLLSAREVPPEGGETQYASMRVAWERLSPELQGLLDGKVAIHSFVYSRGLIADDLLPPEHAAQVPPVPQALVRTNPVNGRKAFYVASHACEIVGMPTA